MRKILGGAAIVVLLLLFTRPLFAQNGQFLFRDTTGQLDQTRIQQAANALTNRGATVAVYMVGSNGGADDFQQRLEEDGLASGQNLNANLIAIYVSLSPRYSELAGGDQWNAALSTNNNIETIRTTKLNPALAAGTFTDGFVNSLDAFNDAITNPPTTGGGTVFNVNFVPLVIGGFVVLALIVGGAAIIMWRSSARTMRAVRDRYEEMKRGAAASIADFAQLLDKAREKAQFDAISYTPADAQRIGAEQQSIERAFQAAQLQFDSTEEQFAQRRSPQIPDYTTATDAFGQVRLQVQELHTQLEQLEAERKTLDGMAQQAPQEIDRAKKA